MQDVENPPDGFSVRCGADRGTEERPDAPISMKLGVSRLFRHKTGGGIGYRGRGYGVGRSALSVQEHQDIEIAALRGT
jgi:hypothetical protein